MENFFRLTASLNSKKSVFLLHSGPYWLRYLSISGPTQPLHFSACSLSSHLFASFSPCLHVSVPHLPPQISSTASFYHLFLHFSLGKTHIFTERLGLGLMKCSRLLGMTYFHQLISLSVYVCLCVISFCFPLFVLRVGRQQSYLCFAHLSPHYLLCHGTVNVSDGDRSGRNSTPSFVMCLFCYPSLTRFLFISARRAGPSLYLVAKFTHWKGREASNKQLRYS